MNAMSQTNTQTTPDPAEPDYHADVNEAVRATAMLADVSISLWGGERTDRAIMDRAKEDAGAVGNVGRAIKNLMSGADANLKTVRGAFTAVRSQHYAMTLPWVSDPHAERLRGPRLLPNMLFDKYMMAMGAKKRAALYALDAFIDSYPADVVQAQANLAGLAVASGYPTPDEVRAAFRIGFDFEPVPMASSFAGLPDDTLAKLGAALGRKQEFMLSGARAYMWAQVRDRLTHLVGRLADPEMVFKTGTIDNVRELVELLPGWNVGRDPRVEDVIARVERAVGHTDAASLRTDNALRAATVGRCRGLIALLDEWGV